MTEEDKDLFITEKQCSRCGLKGYHFENGLCLDCVEAELRKNDGLVLPALNGHNHIKGV